jgi:hypothetical protein
MAGVYDLYLNQGETFNRSFRYLLRDEEGQETPFDLNGYQGRCQIRRAPGQPLAVSVPVDITEPGEGRFAVTLTAAQTAGIAASGKGYDRPEKYVYDIELYTEDGQTVERILNGYVYVSPEVTR